MSTCIKPRHDTYRAAGYRCTFSACCADLEIRPDHDRTCRRHFLHLVSPLFQLFYFSITTYIGGERPARNDQRAASPRPRGHARSGTSDAERDLVSDGRDAATIMLSAHASIPYVSGTGRGRVEAAGAGRFGAQWAPAAERCGRPRAPLSAHRGRTLKPLRLHRPQMSAEPPLPRPASQRRGLRVVLSTHVSRIAPHLLSACY